MLNSSLFPALSNAGQEAFRVPCVLAPSRLRPSDFPLPNTGGFVFLLGILHQKRLPFLPGRHFMECHREEEERTSRGSWPHRRGFSTTTGTKKPLSLSENALHAVGCLRDPGVIVAMKEAWPVAFRNLLGVFDKATKIRSRPPSWGQYQLGAQKGRQPFLDGVSPFGWLLRPQNVPDSDQNDHAHCQPARKPTRFRRGLEDCLQSFEQRPIPPFLRPALETASWTRLSSLCRLIGEGSVVGLPWTRAAARAASQNSNAVAKSGGTGFPSSLALVSSRIRSRWNSRRCSSLLRTSSPSAARSGSMGLATFPR